MFLFCLKIEMAYSMKKRNSGMFSKPVFSENIAENLEKFERFQLKQEEEYAKLCLQLQVSNL